MNTDTYHSTVDPAFCFMLVVWGERYRRLFSQYCLPSLLAPNNIPCIANKRDSKFAIATTAQDWAELERLDVFQLLKSQIEPVLFELPLFTAADPKMLVMSSGHKKLSNYAFNRRAFGININPDSIHSDGMIRALQTSARHGKKLVVYPGFRFELEGVLADLKRSNLLSDKTTLVISPRELAHVAIRNPHPWLSTCNWDNECFFDYPVFHCLTGNRDDLMILHTISMGPIMVDYGAIDLHDDKIFDKWTLDGDYAYSNFGHFDVFSEIEYIDDSDTFMVVSLTPKEDEAIPQNRVPGGILKRNFYKGRSLWRVYSDPVADPLKKRFYLRQVVFHANALGNDWRRLGMRDRRIQNRHVLSRIADYEILAYASKYYRDLGMLRRIALAAHRVWARYAYLTTEAAVSCYGDLTSASSFTLSLSRNSRNGAVTRVLIVALPSIRFLIQKSRSLKFKLNIAFRSTSLYLAQKFRSIVGFILWLVKDQLDSWEAYQNRGVRRAAAGDPLRAAEDFARAIRMAPPNPALHFQRGMALLNAGDRHGAVAEFEAGLKLDPDNVTLRGQLDAYRDGGWGAYQERGIQRDSAGDHLGAAEDFAHAIRISPPNPALHFQRGMALLKAADRQRAVAEFAAGLEIDPDNPTLRGLLDAYGEGGWGDYQQRGIQRESAGDHLGAAEDFGHAIRIGPPNPALHYLRGVALLHAGEPLAAAAEFEAGLKLDPNNAALRHLLDQTCHASKRYLPGLAGRHKDGI